MNPFNNLLFEILFEKDYIRLLDIFLNGKFAFLYNNEYREKHIMYYLLDYYNIENDYNQKLIVNIIKLLVKNKNIIISDDLLDNFGSNYIQEDLYLLNNIHTLNINELKLNLNYYKKKEDRLSQLVVEMIGKELIIRTLNK